MTKPGEGQRGSGGGRCPSLPREERGNPINPSLQNSWSGGKGRWGGEAQGSHPFGDFCRGEKREGEKKKGEGQYARSKRRKGESDGVPCGLFSPREEERKKKGVAMSGEGEEGRRGTTIPYFSCSLYGRSSSVVKGKKRKGGERGEGLLCDSGGGKGGEGRISIFPFWCRA